MDPKNTISFDCTLVTYGSKKKFVEVRLVLDGQLLPGGHTDVADILFGGRCDNVEFYVYTCLFCVPGCAGYHEPISQKRTDGLVIWEISDDKLGRELGSNRLVFDAEAFDAALTHLEAQLKRFEYKGWHSAAFVREGYRRGKEVRTGIPLEEARDDNMRFFRGLEAMKLLHETADDPDNPGTLRYFWHGFPQTEGVTDPNLSSEMSAVDIASSLLNIGQCLTAENQDRADHLAEVAAIVREFGRSGDVESAQARILPFKRFWEEDGFDNVDMRVFGVGPDGPYAASPI